jgi:Fe-S cluster assembly protein SufD
MTVEALARSDDVRDRYRAAFAAVERELPGAALPWMREARHEALERFGEVGFPSLRDEDWKYTRLSAIEKRAFRTRSQGGRLGAADVDALALPGTRRLVFINGRYAPDFALDQGAPPGARIGNLAAALSERIEGLESLLRGADGATANGFDALNAALWGDGAYIDLATGTLLERPIHLLYITSESDIATHPRTIVRARAGSSVSIVEHHVGLGDVVSFTNATTRIVIEPGARVEHCKLQQESPRSFHVGSVGVRQQQDSRFVSCSFALGAALSRIGIDTRLEAPGCEAVLNGLYVAGGRQHVDHHTSIEHIAERGTSREWYRGVLDGRARAVFNGKVVVRPGAQKTDAHQSNRNLLLSEGAEVDTKPQLEIYADDVKCTHGATVGALDDDQVFYLRSRGLDERSARNMLTLAFADEIVGRCGIEPLRERVRTVLGGRLLKLATPGMSA